jgi:N-acyl-D-amino-acid deacylase
VLDGDTQPRRADVGISGSRIAAVGDLRDAESARVIDATNALVAPGLIDAHFHGEALMLAGESMLPAIHQGVTTVILGQDGTSLAPGGATTVGYMRGYFGVVNGDPPELEAGALGVGELLARLSGRTEVNVAYLVPNGNVRCEVMGHERRSATARELREMQALVEAGLAEGAIGLSSGLDYIPSRYADTAELAALCAPLARHGGVYVTHMRGYGPRAAEGFDEAVEVASASGVPLHISHFLGRADEVIPHLERAEARGSHPTFDSYPYVASSTILGMALLPPWVQAGGVDRTLERLASRAVQERLRDEWSRGYPRDPAQLILAAVRAPAYHWSEGLALDRAAEDAGVDLVEFVCDLLVTSNYQVGVVDRRVGGYTEDDIRTVLRHQAHMAGSDGTYCGGVPHPRGWGHIRALLGAVHPGSRRLHMERCRGASRHSGRASVLPAGSGRAQARILRRHDRLPQRPTRRTGYVPGPQAARRGHGPCARQRHGRVGGGALHGSATGRGGGIVMRAPPRRPSSATR